MVITQTQDQLGIKHRTVMALILEQIQMETFIEVIITLAPIGILMEQRVLELVHIELVTKITS